MALLGLLTPDATSHGNQAWTVRASIQQTSSGAQFNVIEAAPMTRISPASGAYNTPVTISGSMPQPFTFL